MIDRPDPTLNVRELVAANEHFRDALRSADIEFNRMARAQDVRRYDELSAQRAAFDQIQISALIRQLEHNTTLLQSQLDQSMSGVNERITKLEQFRYESSGKGMGATMVMAYVVTAISMLIAAGSVAIAIFRH